MSWVSAAWNGCSSRVAALRLWNLEGSKGVREAEATSQVTASTLMIYTYMYTHTCVYRLSKLKIYDT